MTAERRVLGRRGHQHDPAVLDARQQRVLLGLGEPVDLVQEQHGLAVVAGRGAAGLLHDRADVLDPGGDRGQLDEATLERPRDQVGERRLAGPRRPPEDHRGGPAAPPEPSTRRRNGQPGREQVGLAPDLVERAGPHPDRERAPRPPRPQRRARARSARRRREEVHRGAVRHQASVKADASATLQPWHRAPHRQRPCEVPRHLRRCPACSSAWASPNPPPASEAVRHVTLASRARRWVLATAPAFAVAVAGLTGESLFDRLHAGAPETPSPPERPGPHRGADETARESLTL